MENTPEPRKKSEAEQLGGTFGIVLIVVVLAIGGIYFLIQQHTKIEQDKQQLEQPTNS